MSKLILDLPRGSDSSVYVDYDSDVDELNQDLVNVRLPNGVYIEAGWFPENDPSGKFQIRVIAGRDEVLTATADDVTHLKSTIETLSIRFSQSHVVSASSGNSGRIPDLVT